MQLPLEKKRESAEQEKTAIEQIIYEIENNDGGDAKKIKNLIKEALAEKLPQNKNPKDLLYVMEMLFSSPVEEDEKKPLKDKKSSNYERSDFNQSLLEEDEITDLYELAKKIFNSIPLEPTIIAQFCSILFGALPQEAVNNQKEADSVILHYSVILEIFKNELELNVEFNKSLVTAIDQFLIKNKKFGLQEKITILLSELGRIREEGTQLKDNIVKGRQLWKSNQDEAFAKLDELFKLKNQLFSEKLESTAQQQKLETFKAVYQQVYGFYEALIESKENIEENTEKFFGRLLKSLPEENSLVVGGRKNYSEHLENLKADSSVYLWVWKYFFDGFDENNSIFRDFLTKAQAFVNANEESQKYLGNSEKLDWTQLTRKLAKYSASSQKEVILHPHQLALSTQVVRPWRRMLNKIWGFKEDELKTGWDYAWQLVSGTVFLGFTVIKRLVVKPLNDWTDGNNVNGGWKALNFILKLVFRPDKLTQETESGLGKFAIVLTNVLIWFGIGLALPPLLGMAGWTWTMGYLPAVFASLEMISIGTIPLFVGLAGATYALLYQLVSWIEHRFEAKNFATPVAAFTNVPIDDSKVREDERVPKNNVTDTLTSVSTSLPFTQNSDDTNTRGSTSASSAQNSTQISNRSSVSELPRDTVVTQPDTSATITTTVATAPSIPQVTNTDSLADLESSDDEFEGGSHHVNHSSTVTTSTTTTVATAPSTPQVLYGSTDFTVGAVSDNKRLSTVDALPRPGSSDILGGWLEAAEQQRTRDSKKGSNEHSLLGRESSSLKEDLQDLDGSRRSQEIRGTSRRSSIVDSEIECDLQLSPCNSSTPTSASSTVTFFAKPSAGSTPDRTPAGTPRTLCGEREDIEDIHTTLIQTSSNGLP